MKKKYIKPEIVVETIETPKILAGSFCSDDDMDMYNDIDSYDNMNDYIDYCDKCGMPKDFCHCNMPH